MAGRPSMTKNGPVVLKSPAGSKSAESRKADISSAWSNKPRVPKLVSYRKGITTDDARRRSKMELHHHLLLHGQAGAPAAPIDVGSEEGRKGTGRPTARVA